MDLCPRFLVPFLRSIFDPFLANSLRAICFIYWVFSISMSVLDPFLDPFLHVHFIMIFATLGLMSLARAYPWIASNKIRGFAR